MRLESRSHLLVRHILDKLSVGKARIFLQKSLRSLDCQIKSSIIIDTGFVAVERFLVIADFRKNIVVFLSTRESFLDVIFAIVVIERRFLFFLRLFLFFLFLLGLFLFFVAIALAFLLFLRVL
jgi:hypothetical protein